MEFVVRKTDLVKELSLVQGIVERKNSIPILANVLLEAERGGGLRISATDLDVSLRSSCAADVATPGALTLGAKKLFEIARVLPDADVRVAVGADGWASLECERVRYRMAGLPREDFPALPEAEGGAAVELPAAPLREMILRTAFAITAEDARYYLSGALLVLESDSCALVATDGHRLAYCRATASLEVKEPRRILVPRKAVHELARLLEGADSVAFEAREAHLLFRSGGRTLACKTIEGQFPAFERVVAVTGERKVELSREALVTAVRRVSLLSSERSRAVRVALGKGKLELSAQSPDQGEARETLVVEEPGPELEIGFNAAYLLDFLGVAGTETVWLELKDAESQGLLRPGGDAAALDYRYVVMPMRF